MLIYFVYLYLLLLTRLFTASLNFISSKYCLGLNTLFFFKFYDYIFRNVIYGLRFCKEAVICFNYSNVCIISAFMPASAF